MPSKELTLTDQAEAIITSKIQTSADNKRLAKIKFLMAVQYNKALSLAGKQEDDYNLKRAETTKKAIDEGLPVGQAEAVGKFAAEFAFPYREKQNTVKGMASVIKSIGDFSIGWAIENKAAGAYVDTNPTD